MPPNERTDFGRFPRRDMIAGYEERVPTAMGFKEPDGADARMIRVRVYDLEGDLVRTSLQDLMGVRFSDLPDVPDDPEYLESLR